MTFGINIQNTLVLAPASRRYVPFTSFTGPVLRQRVQLNEMF